MDPSSGISSPSEIVRPRLARLPFGPRGTTLTAAAAFFVTYEELKKHIPAFLPDNTPGLNHMLSASGGEFVSCLIRVPTEVVKSRTQTGAYGAGSSSLTTAINTLRYEGVRGFYRGFGITIAREIPFTSIQFPLYEWLKRTLSTQYLEGRRPNSPEAAVCGSIAGGIAAALTTPLDVVKTRVMLEARQTADGRPAPSPSVLSFPRRLVQIATAEGPTALFRGWVPRTIAIGAGGAVFLGIYDFCVNIGRDRSESTLA